MEQGLVQSENCWDLRLHLRRMLLGRWRFSVCREGLRSTAETGTFTPVCISQTLQLGSTGVSPKDSSVTLGWSAHGRREDSPAHMSQSGLLRARQAFKHTKAGGTAEQLPKLWTSSPKEKRQTQVLQHPLKLSVQRRLKSLEVWPILHS